MVELSSPHLPDLTLVDLPGIVRTSTAGQPESVIRDVDRLIQSYLNQVCAIGSCVMKKEEGVCRCFE
jgi:interferon-induced GTP-binding protein Mx1